MNLIETLSKIKTEADYGKGEDVASLEMRLTRIYGMVEGTFLAATNMPIDSAEQLALRVIRAEDTIKSVARSDDHEEAVGLAEQYLSTDLHLT